MGVVNFNHANKFPFSDHTKVLCWMSEFRPTFCRGVTSKERQRRSEEGFPSLQILVTPYSGSISPELQGPTSNVVPPSVWPIVYKNTEKNRPAQTQRGAGFWEVRRNTTWCKVTSTWWAPASWTLETEVTPHSAGEQGWGRMACLLGRGRIFRQSCMSHHFHFHSLNLWGGGRGRFDQ